MTRRRRAEIGFAAVLFVVLGLAVRWAGPSRGRLDPAAVAAAETRMWQAYYAGDTTRLGIELIRLLRSHYGLSLWDAKDVGERFAGAAMTFRDTRSDYEPAVLPGLTDAYARLGQATGRPIQADAAARAELAWWVARRRPGSRSPQQVGRRIAELYAALYGGPVDDFLEAGVLRATAAATRDRAGDAVDWAEIESQLRDSYQALADVGGVSW